ncbi:MAG: hypothetical protein RL238_3114 [Actinomycetota bacterium]|jgi:peptidoglycan LD-endopeptidase LytH
MLRSPLVLVPLVMGLIVPVAVQAAEPSPAVSAPAVVAAPVASADETATATATAVRLQKLAPPNFPMDPLPRCYVLDNFGDPRSGGRTHQGTDILASLGQEVYAMADGTLTFQAKVGDGKSGTSLSGNLWKLTAAGGTYYVYAHLSGFAPGLTVGSVVYKGQLIGYVGDTGNAGPGNYHLHFEVHPNGGAAVNPLPLLTVPKSCTVY